MEFGLCCLFHREPIKFKTFTMKNIREKKDKTIIEKVFENNIFSLQKAFDYCYKHDIKSYRVSSNIFPSLSLILKEGFIDEEFLNRYLKKLRELNSYDLILSFHPSQFVNMGSPDDKVVENSIIDLKEHLLLAKELNIDEINIHLGGAYGDKKTTKKRFMVNMEKFLKDDIKFITIENDELNYSIKDVIEVANKLGIRATYDVHHQRCYELKDKLNLHEEEYFLKARETWKSYTYQRIHLSSPKDSYTTAMKSRPHSDYIDINDFPKWIYKYENVHIDIEAKAKERAIFELRESLISSSK